MGFIEPHAYREVSLLSTLAMMNRNGGYPTRHGLIDMDSGHWLRESTRLSREEIIDKLIDKRFVSIKRGRYKPHIWNLEITEEGRQALARRLGLG